MAHLYIIRGLPGSGKTTFAKRLLLHKVVAGICEADTFFMREGGTYVFDPTRIKEAHEWCRKQVFGLLKTPGHDDSVNVAVSNTFTTIWEMQPYIDYCQHHGHTFTVITCEGHYGNVQGVSDATIEKMRKRWEKY